MTDDRIPDIAAVRSPQRRSLHYDQLSSMEEPIDAGGQGIVYKSAIRGVTPSSQIAVKEPAIDSKTLEKDTVEAFVKEANTWETVDRREREKQRWRDSEHIVGVIDTGDDLPWIAMEYMDAGGLDDRLDKNPAGLPIRETLWIAECICRGVELAHNYGIAHLDLKPANVLFRETPSDVWDVPKIADWGLARVLAEQTGTVRGLSINYAAPEQFNSDEFGDPDMLTDIYQVGALVYAMLTGKPPYTGNQASVVHDIVYGDDPLRPEIHRSELPDAVAETLSCALNKKKTRRYQTITSLREAFENLRTDEALADMVGMNPDISGRQAGMKSKDNQQNTQSFNIPAITRLSNRIKDIRSRDSNKSLPLTKAISQSSSAVSLSERIRGTDSD